MMRDRSASTSSLGCLAGKIWRTFIEWSRRSAARDGQRLAASKPADVMESVEDKVHEATGAVSDVQDKV